MRSFVWRRRGRNLRYKSDRAIFSLSLFSFPCLSADYNIVSLTCSLSRETRRTQPGSYQESRDTEYLENSCVPSEKFNCPYKRTDNAYPRYLDTIVTR